MSIYTAHCKYLFLPYVCLFSPVLGSADILSSAPVSTHLQPIQRQSSPPPISFKRPVLSSTPRQFVVKMQVVMFSSLRQVSLSSGLLVCVPLLGDSVNVFVSVGVHHHSLISLESFVLCVLSIHSLFPATATNSNPKL